MSISPNKEQSLREKMKSLGIFEHDIEESFVRSSGAGGQHVNKTSSCVQLLHRPTGLQVKCQEDRSQAINRFRARRLLVEKIESQVLGRKTAEQQAREKIRRQKRRRSRRAKEKMLANKHHRSQILENRRIPD
ncbi:MAG: peptide chain release factor-like protein [Elusimicrobiota bacterium]